MMNFEWPELMLTDAFAVLAEQGDAEAQYNLADEYGTGVWKVSNYIKSLEQEKQRFSAHDIDSDDFIDGLIDKAEEKRKEYKDAHINWLTKSGEGGHEAAIDALVEFYDDSETADADKCEYWTNKQKAFVFARAEQGNVAACFEAASSSLLGWGDKPGAKTALDFVDKALASQDRAAIDAAFLDTHTTVILNALGTRLLRGDGMPSDPEKAVAFFRQAAGLFGGQDDMTEVPAGCWINVDAVGKLADCYENGLGGLAQDPARANRLRAWTADKQPREPGRELVYRFDKKGSIGDIHDHHTL